jgi:hypothetical protein
MPALALVGVVLAAACGTYVIFAAVRRLRTPPELRDDWWDQFEREFRAYARRAAGHEYRRRHRGNRA